MAVEEKKKIKNNSNKKSKSNKVASLSALYRGFKAEIKRITWPTKNEIKKATTAVVVLCLIYVVYVGLIDYGFKNLFDLMFKK